MSVLRSIFADLANADLGRTCSRSPAPGYPEEDRPVAECLVVVLEEEIEHYRYATRDLASWSRDWRHDRVTPMPSTELSPAPGSRVIT